MSMTLLVTRQTQLRTETHGHSAHSTEGSSDNLLTNRSGHANHRHHPKYEQLVATWDFTIVHLLINT